MITKITKESFAHILKILENQSTQTGIYTTPEVTIENYQKFISDGIHEVFFYSDDQGNQGISLIIPDESLMVNFYTEPSNDDEGFSKEFFNWVHQYIKFDTGTFVTRFPKFTQDILDYMISLGIECLERVKMSINREKIEDLVQIKLSEDQQFSPWEDGYANEIAELTVNAYKGSHESRIFVYFQHMSKTLGVIKNIVSNKIGMFDPYISQVLLENDKPIGICFIVRGKSKGFIPHIAISPHKSGMGLGKALLIQCLKETVVKYPIDEVELSVTVKNTNAMGLYTTIGFRVIDTGKTYIH